MSVSVGPEAKSGLAGWFWLKVSHEAAVKVQRVPQPLKAGLGPKGWLLRGLTPMDGKFMVPVGRKPQFFTLWTFPQGCLCVLATWQLALSRRDPRGRRVETIMSAVT